MTTFGQVMNELIQLVPVRDETTLMRWKAAVEEFDSLIAPLYEKTANSADTAMHEQNVKQEIERAAEVVKEAIEGIV